MIKETRISSSINILMILYILHGLMPFVAINTPTLVNASLDIILFTVLFSRLNSLEFKQMVPMFLIPVLNLLFYTSGGNAISILSGIAQLMQTIIYTMCAFVVLKNKDFKSAKMILIVYFACVTITCITTYYGCKTIPGAARLIATDIDQTDPRFAQILNLNIGGFGFVYSNVLISVILIMLIKFRSEIHNKYIISFSILLLGLIFASIIATEYTTALLLFACSMLLFPFSKVFRIKKVITVLIVFSILFLALRPVIVEGLNFAAQMAPSEEISVRLSDLSSSINGEEHDDEADIEIRKNKYQKSIDIFTSSPLGTWGKKVDIGGHSYILDNLAKYGLLGIFFIWLMLKRIYQLYLLPCKDKPYYGYLLVILLLSCVMISVNTGIYYPVLTFVMPLVTLLFDRYVISSKT